VWLEQQLARSPGDYTIVVGHYPVYSDGPSGDVMAVTALPALLKEYGASVYISGHDESLQHLVVRVVCTVLQYYSYPDHHWIALPCSTTASTMS
jgi:hypothetical protein